MKMTSSSLQFEVAMTLGGAAQVVPAHYPNEWTLDLQSPAITDPPMPRPAALWPSPRRVLQQWLTTFSSEYYQIIIATHLPTPDLLCSHITWSCGPVLLHGDLLSSLDICYVFGVKALRGWRLWCVVCSMLCSRARVAGSSRWNNWFSMVQTSISRTLAVTRRCTSVLLTTRLLTGCISDRNFTVSRLSSRNFY